MDQLSLTAPNPRFIESATNHFRRAGYEVAYVPGREATVPLFQSLAAGDYEVIVLRVHSARIAVTDSNGSNEKSDDVALFTGQVIDLDEYHVLGVPPAAATAVAREKDRVRNASDPDRHDASRRRWPETTGAPEASSTEGVLSPDEASRLIPVFYDPDSGELPFFGIRPEFIARDLEGTFDGSVVVLMGCDGLRSDNMAEAFIQRGAEIFISWDEPVSAAHTDRVTERLLDLWLVQGLTPREAARYAMEELGPDPQYGAHLVVYP